VDGAKKWITNGIWADYCTAAVRTGGPGRKGVSVLVLPLNEKGVTRKRMHNSGVNASGKETCTLENESLDLTISQAPPSLNLTMFVFQPIIL
jgi:alkylation response protein AidB-like acyl-CoA dehydrogenase